MNPALRNQTWLLSTIKGLCLVMLPGIPDIIRNIRNSFTKKMSVLTALVLSYVPDNVNLGLNTMLTTNDNSFTGIVEIPMSYSNATTATSIVANAPSVISSFCTSNGLPAPTTVNWAFNASQMISRTYNFPSLAVNTARQPSTSYDTFVTASVPITTTLSLTTGQTGTVTLQYADDSGFTTNVQTVQPSENGNTGSLTVGLNLGQIVSATVSGMIPASKYYRLLTTSNTGTPTFGTPVIEEVVGV